MSKALFLIACFLLINFSKELEQNQQICDIRKYIKNHNMVLEEVSNLLRKHLLTYDLDDTEDCPAYQRRDCADLYTVEGVKSDGVYTVYPDGKVEVRVYCDMTTSGGGWTVFQRRQDGSVNFNQSWQGYKHGFGDLAGEFWLGNSALSLLTSQRLNTLRIDLTDFDNIKRYAEYSDFLVLPEDRRFRLVFAAFDGYTGDAGNSLYPHNGNAFSTYDQDNDVSNTEHCSQHTGAGFWFYSCQMVGLNGPYSDKPNVYPGKGIVWREWHGSEVSLKATQMKFRPIDFNSY